MRDPHAESNRAAAPGGREGVPRGHARDQQRADSRAAAPRESAGRGRRADGNAEDHEALTQRRGRTIVAFAFDPASSRTLRPKPDDDPHELVAALAALIFECGPQSGCTLAVGVRRRKADVLVELHAGPFRQVGKGRSARWEIAPEESIPAAVVRFRDGVSKARRNGVIDAAKRLSSCSHHRLR